MKFEFCAHSARLLRKLDHVFLWILSNNTGLQQCSIEKSKENFNDQQCFAFTLCSLPGQLKPKFKQIVTILLKSLLKSLRLYFKITGKAQTPNISQMCCRIKILSAFGLFNFHRESLISALNYKCRKCKYNFREDLASLQCNSVTKVCCNNVTVQMPYKGDKQESV